jgi:hypothetical protein
MTMATQIPLQKSGTWVALLLGVWPRDISTGITSTEDRHLAKAMSLPLGHLLN